MMKQFIKILSTQADNLLSLFDQALISGSNFILAILLTRILGLKEFGVFSFGILIILFISSIQQAFIIQPMLTLAPKKALTDKITYLNSLLRLNFGFSLAGTGVVFLIGKYSAIFLTNWNFQEYALQLAITVFFYLNYDFFRKCFFVLNKIKYAILIDTIAFPLVVLIIVAVYLFYTLSVHIVYIVFSLGLLSASIVSLRFFKFKKINFYDLSKCLKKQWKFSSWLLGTAILQLLSGNLFIIAAVSILGPIALGAIRIGQNVMGIINVALMAIENRVPIVAARIYHLNDINNLNTYLIKLTKTGFIVFSIIAFTISILSAEILELLYGLEYRSYFYVLIGFAIHSVIVFLGTPLRIALRTLEKTHPIFISYLITAVFGITLAIPMVKAAGIFGVLAGLMICQLMMSAFYYFTLKKSKQ